MAVLSLSSKNKEDALRRTVTKGTLLPLRWAPQSIMLFPQGDGFNKLEVIAGTQTRHVLQESAASASLTAAGFATVKGERKTAFKYQAKSSKFSQLVMPLVYNKPAKAYMEARQSSDPNTRFAYMSGVYDGSAFVEVLTDARTSGSGNYAAFQMDGTYYTTSGFGEIKTGSIIYQIQPITTNELLDVNTPPPAHKPSYVPMSDAQLENALQKGGEELRPMILPK